MRRTASMTVSGVLGALLLTSCSLIGTGDDDSAADPSTGTSGGTVTGGPVVLVTLAVAVGLFVLIGRRRSGPPTTHVPGER